MSPLGAETIRLPGGVVDFVEGVEASESLTALRPLKVAVGG
jgi:hypothetical protein